MLLWRKSAVSLARRTRPRKALSTLSFPTDQGVDDDFVRVTFIDYLGGRHERRGRVGQTLVDVCRAHGMDLLEDDSVNQVRAPVDTSSPSSSLRSISLFFFR